MIDASELAARLEGLVPIGLSDEGTTRLAWSDEDAAAGEWFAAQAATAGLRVERDPAGNRWAVPDAPGPWWAVGSHTDSVRRGGRYDGALGVAAGFAVAAHAARAAAPVAVISFADEEGARFNTPTFGSRALVGRLDVDDVVARVDDRGVALGDAMRAAGVDPGGLREAPAWLERLRGFLELHIDQTRDLFEAGAAAGAVSRLATRLRVQAELRGRADHAGTTRGADRHDALMAAARLIVRAGELAGPEMVATAARIEVEPNAPTTVPERVRLWLDGRGPDTEEVDGWRAAMEREAKGLTGVEVTVRLASRSEGIELDRGVRAELACALPGGAPELLCYAGHDAGVIAERRPAGMVLVRNERGISHAPEEDVALEDAAVGASALLAAVEALAAR